jgi:hypothetical protein
MKKLLFMIILSANVFGQSNDPVISVEKGQTKLSIHRLRCTVLAGHNENQSLRDRLFTVLGDSDSDSPHGITLIRPNGVTIELSHHLAQAGGCPIEELDLRKKESSMRFGFIDAKVTLTKKSSGPFINGFGKCVERYNEELELEITPNVTVKSFEGEIREVTGC